MSRSNAPRTMNVGIIDDAPTSRQIIRRLMEEAGDVSCTEFADASQALVWCSTSDPDLLIVDYHMPGIDGLDFLERARTSHGKTCPIVFVTSDSQRALRHAALQRGAADFLNKPVDPDEFVARIRNLLDLRAEQTHLRERTRQHLHRMEALWRLAVRSDLTGDQLIFEMLEESAVALNGGKHFFGVICEIGKDEVVARYKGDKAWSRTGHDPQMHPFPVGKPVKLDESLSYLLPVDGRARAWSDLARDGSTKHLAHSRAGLRAAIGVRFFVELKTYALIFFSYEENVEHFSHSDYTFVELIASFFASKLREIEHANVIRFQAYHDTLTGLINRNGLRTHLREAVGAHATSRHTLAVAVLDVDQFKEINDTLGAEAGDVVLQTTASRLQDAIRPGDTLGRLDANSFVLSFKNLERVDQAEELTHAAINAISSPLAVGDAVIRLTASAGIALYPNDAVDADELIARADAALDLAKQHGRNRIEFSSRDIDDRFRHRQVLRQSILRGIGSNEFELHFQPEIDLATGLPIAAEALVRWNHPDGHLSPSEFIPFAEENGLIGPLSLYIMRRAMLDATVLGRLLPNFRLFFNLSSHDLINPSFIQEFEKALGEYQVAPALLGVEVTESSAMHDVAQAVKVLEHLRSLGIAIALDDFGTGYSSLAILKSLPIDIIKLDRTFIAGLPTNPTDVAIARNLINIGHDLGRTILVEGVETPEQYHWLREHGCDRAQGFYLGKPMSRDALIGWLGVRVA